MNVLVTGGTGFLGRSLVKLLLNHNLQVNILTRQKGACSIFFDNKNCQEIIGDITDQNTLKSIFRKWDIVFHLAGMFKYGNTNYRDMYRINILGTKNIIELCKYFKVPKVVYISSLGIYHPTGDKEITEMDFYNLKHKINYTKTKTEAHQIIEDFIQQGLPIIIVLPASVYGPESTGFGEFIDLFLKRKLIIKPPSKSMLSLVDVNDVAQGLMLVAEKGKIGEHYILSAINKSMQEIMDRITFITGVKSPTISVPYRLILPFVKIIDFYNQLIKQNSIINSEMTHFIYGGLLGSGRKAMIELGWQPSDFYQTFDKMIFYHFNKIQNNKR